MFTEDFNQLIQEFGVPIRLNIETVTRKAILTNSKVSDSLPNFDDKSIHTNFKIKRGDVIAYEGVKYLIITDIQSKRSYEYKATIRPMTNTFTYTYYSDGYYEEVDRHGSPIWIIEPGELTEELPCVAFQEGSPTLTSGQIVMPETRIKIIMPDNEVTALIAMTSEHSIINHNYRVVDINLLQSGLRIFTMEWVAQSA
ncbi:hypothetical protein [Oceanobacillus massiliensis]|uniref:hypothetical protein n=1 Tax=Oceanobacillus massiliensis TaxID=1465765 RepID=UPI000287CDF5|nr:hypothetical protein [Oceanobacillus massiliensis]